METLDTGILQEVRIIGPRNQWVSTFFGGQPIEYKGNKVLNSSIESETMSPSTETRRGIIFNEKKEKYQIVARKAADLGDP